MSASRGPSADGFGPRFLAMAPRVPFDRGGSRRALDRLPPAGIHTRTSNLNDSGLRKILQLPYCNLVLLSYTGFTVGDRPRPPENGPGSVQPPPGPVARIVGESRR